MTCKMKKSIREIKFNHENDAFEINSINDDVKFGLNRSWYEKVRIEDNFVIFKLDTDADANILPLRFASKFKNLKFEKCQRAVEAYGGTTLKVIGEIECVTMVWNSITIQKFLVIDTNSVPILNLSACTKLNLVQRVMSIENSKDRFVERNFDVFNDYLGFL